jgi:hypothetical protein
MKRNDFYVSKVLSSCLMGDGSIQKDTSGGRLNRNARFVMKQLVSHRDHLDYVADALDFTKIAFDVIEPKKSTMSCGRVINPKPAFALRTMAHPTYTDFWRRWYLNRVKRIDPHALTLVDAEFMANWYMQDGYTTQRNDCVNHDTVLCTDNFSYGDLEMMRKAIIEKTGFIFNIRRRSTNKKGEYTYRMYLYRKQTPAFREYIAPHIQPSFLYKITGDAYRKVGDDIV